MKKSKQKKIKTTVMVLIIGAVLIAAVYAASFAVDRIMHDPNFEMRYLSKTIKLDETKKVSYESSWLNPGKTVHMPVLCFKPAESASYTVTISNIKSEKGVYLKLSVMDSELTDFVYADNIPRGKEKNDDSEISGSAHLNKGKKYYIVTDAGGKLRRGSTSGSFEITVSKTPEDDGPDEIKEGETVSVTIEPNENASLSFTPETDGYYRFESVITGKRAVAGFSGIGSISSAGGEELDEFGGIAYLEAGTEYYVVVNTDEAENRKVKAAVSCTEVGQQTAEGHCTLDITGETVIEYTAGSTELTAVWSESEGNPYAVVYDEKGVPVGTDNSSGEAFSGNKKDFALVFQAKNHKKYHIFIGGRFDAGKISISSYTGDGTTLDPDSVAVIADGISEPETGVSDEQKTNADDGQETDIPLD